MTTARTLAATLAAAVILTGCGSTTVGQPCTTIGATARTKTGAYLVCKAPATTDPTNTARWRRA